MIRYEVEKTLMKITTLINQQNCKITSEGTLIQAVAQRARALGNRKRGGTKPMGKGTWKHGLSKK